MQQKQRAKAWKIYTQYSTIIHYYNECILPLIELLQHMS